MFTPEEFLQERNINSYYEQDRIRKRVAEYKAIIENTQHFLSQVQAGCTHPNTEMVGSTDELETYYTYTCSDCYKTWTTNG
jgi:hypothetical protein